jgi:hypothetical protein
MGVGHGYFYRVLTTTYLKGPGCYGKQRDEGVELIYFNFLGVWPWQALQEKDLIREIFENK